MEGEPQTVTDRFEKALGELAENLKMARKYQSWGNAADALDKVDALLFALRVLWGANEFYCREDRHVWVDVPNARVLASLDEEPHMRAQFACTKAIEILEGK